MKLTDAQVGKVQETLREVSEKHQDDYDCSPRRLARRTAGEDGHPPQDDRPAK